jgi:hypothetical protein
MTLLVDALRSFCVNPGNTAGMAIGTDGIKSSSRICMVALCPLEGEPISVFVRGAAIADTRQYHGIPDEVYNSLAVEPEDARQILEDMLAMRGITNIVTHQAFHFVRDRVIDQKIMRSSTTFLDTALMDKAILYWNDRYREASNLLELQARIERSRGKNRVKLQELLDKYDIEELSYGEKSPYDPENKARMARDIFEAQLDTELPF